MSDKFSQALSLLTDAYNAEIKKNYGYTTARETAVKFQYDLRLYIETELKKKTSADVILVEVLKRLKEVTPHGPENKIDP